MSKNQELVQLKDLLNSKWWEILTEVLKKRRVALASHILYDKYMKTPDKDLTPADLYSAEIRCLNWLIDRLPEEMVNNPDYDPEVLTPEEEDEKEKNELLDDMFKQEA